jgi:excisionase family DNA binding protein
MAKKSNNATSTELDPNANAFRTPNAARFSGMSERTIQRLIASRELPSARVGKIRLVRRKDLEEFLARKVIAS